MVKKLVVSMLAVMLMAGAVYADEIIDQIDLAKEFYQEGRYSEAVEEFQFAIAQIQQLQFEQLKKVFPQPLKGWEADEPEGTAAGMSFLGGGIVISRNYYREETDESVDIQIMANSPLLQSIMMFIQNPALLAAQPGSKMIRIHGKKAILKFSSQDREGELSFVVGTKTLVTVSGNEITDASAMVQYAENINVDLIKKIVGE